MLFPELTCFTYPVDLLYLENRKSDDNSLRLHSSKPLKVDVADPPVPQLDICLDIAALGIHCRFYLIRIENEQATFSPSSSDEPTLAFDEASSLVEPDLHALLHDSAD